MVGSMTTFSPLISENVRSTARRSAPWKSSDTGWPVNFDGLAPRSPAASCASVDWAWPVIAAGRTGAATAVTTAGEGVVEGGVTTTGAGAATTGAGSGAGTRAGAGSGRAGPSPATTTGAPKITRSSSLSVPADSTR